MVHKHSARTIIQTVIDRHCLHAWDTESIAHSISACSIFQRSTHRFSLRAWNKKDNTPTRLKCSKVYSFFFFTDICTCRVLQTAKNRLSIHNEKNNIQIISACIEVQRLILSHILHYVDFIG